MYTTKLVNKNIVEGGKYISIGDEYKDPKYNIFRQPKKGEKPPTPFIIKSQASTENGFFTKATYSPSAFKENILYISTQPIEKRVKGFGSRDASRRDEFTSAVRSEQYRENVKKEQTIIPSVSLNQLEQTETLTRAMTAPANLDFPYTLNVPKYDIGRTRVTQFDPKSTRDHYYKFATDREKVVGPYRPSSTDIGIEAWRTEYKPPAYGSKAENQYFYDKSHL